MIRTLLLLASGLSALGPLPSAAAGIRETVDTDLIIASRGQSDAKITVSPSAGRWEKKAAEDLAYCIQGMTGAKVPIVTQRQAIDRALGTRSPLLVIGQEAIKAQGKLSGALRAVLKKNPHLRTDGIILLREGNRVYLAGNNDPSHYYAVAELLRRWGCRWYMPTEFGECIAEVRQLRVGELDYVYCSPFEIRSYWISWLGDGSGAEEFQMRNMMTGRSAMPPTGHALGGIFTTTRLEGDGTAWWPGEVRQYRDLLSLTDGSRGKLVARLPLKWAFRRDPDRKGLQRGYHQKPVDLACWNAHRDEYDTQSRKDYPPNQWEMLRTDLYVQAQGIRHSDRQSFVGDIWYRSGVELTTEQAEGTVHLRLPGVFNECWLYINGQEVGHRNQGRLYWLNDYRFEWDVDLAGRLRAGKNTFALRCRCQHHFGGMFRRPFLYRIITP